uniref:Uncharacterized protein n=1 Tax=Arundo donax TaxID=35708 RepID=A0A0A9AWU2_ARUDO
MFFSRNCKLESTTIPTHV